EHDGDVDSFLASAADMEAFIEGTLAACDYVRAKRRDPKRINISFDEWNVWYMQNSPHPEPEPWQVAPRLLEDIYTVTDAVVVGSLLISLLRHCDRVTAACLAQLVNVIAPIMTEPGGPAWRQTTFYPFADAARYGRGQVLHLATESPSHDTARHGTVPLLHATAVAGEDGAPTLFAVNRDVARPMALQADLRALPPTRSPTGPPRGTRASRLSTAARCGWSCRRCRGTRCGWADPEPLGAGRTPGPYSRCCQYSRRVTTWAERLVHPDHVGVARGVAG